MIFKRAIYNQQLKCVAFEILYSLKEPINKEQSNLFLQLISTTGLEFPLFIPLN